MSALPDRLNPGGVLAKTAKGLRAAPKEQGLSAAASMLLAAVDGRSDLEALRRRAAGLRMDEVPRAAEELLRGGYVQPLGSPALLPAEPDPAGESSAALGSLDFTRLRATQKLRQAAALSKAREVQRAADERIAARAEAGRAAVEREQAEREAREAQARLESETRGMLVKVLRPRVEEALRVKLAAALRPKIEEELRGRIAAALRPALEASLRPKVELELRARFARQIAEMSARAKTAAPHALAGAPADEDAARLLACLGEAVFATDALGVLTQVNAAWTQLTGRDEEQSTGKALAELFADGDRRGVQDFLVRVAQGTAIRFAHEAAMERDGSGAAWVELRAAPLTASRPGGAAGVCGVLREAGESRRAAAELEEVSLRLLLLVDESDAGVLIETAEGTIRQVNPAFCALFGVQAAPFSFEGAAVAELIQQAAPALADVDEFLARMARIRAAAQDVDGDALALRGAGAASLSYRAVAEDAAPRGHLWIFRLHAAGGSVENTV